MDMSHWPSHQKLDCSNSVVVAFGWWVTWGARLRGIGRCWGRVTFRALAATQRRKERDAGQSQPKQQKAKTQKQQNTEYNSTSGDIVVTLAKEFTWDEVVASLYYTRSRVKRMTGGGGCISRVAEERRSSKKRKGNQSLTGKEEQRGERAERVKSKRQTTTTTTTTTFHLGG